MSAVNSLNNYLEGQPPRQRVMLYVALIIAIFTLAYFFFFSDMINDYESKQDERVQKEAKVTQLLQSISFKKIKTLKQELQQKKKNIEDIQIKLNQKRNSLTAMTFMSTDDSKIAAFLEDLMSHSRKLNVTLGEVGIDSKQLPYIGLLELKKNINFTGNGDFLDILRLIRFVEEQDILLTLNSLSIKQGEGNNQIFNVSFKVAGIL